MTEKDKKLIQLAKEADRFDYEFIGSLVDKAESEEAKEELRRREYDALNMVEIWEFDF